MHHEFEQIDALHFVPRVSGQVFKLLVAEKELHGGIADSYSVADAFEQSAVSILLLAEGPVGLFQFKGSLEDAFFQFGIDFFQFIPRQSQFIRPGIDQGFQFFIEVLNPEFGLFLFRDVLNRSDGTNGL